MPKITIPAEELRKFGSMEIFMNENLVSPVSSYDAELTGTFMNDCIMNFIEYLKEKNLVFKSLRFSLDIDYLPCIFDYAPAKTLIIPEGIHKINDFSICNCIVQKLVIPSSVQNIAPKAFNNSKFKKIELSKNNRFFTMKEKFLVNNLTGATVIFEADSGAPQIIEKINTPQNITLWNNMKSAYNFSAEGPVFWKNNYEEIKPKLKRNDFSELAANRLEALNIFLYKNPDALENLFLIPCDILDKQEYLIRNSLTSFIKIIKSFSGKNKAKTGDNRNKEILLYTTKLFHPGTEPLLFVAAENGIELFAPQINLYLFFPDEEIAFIPSYLDYLKINFIAITKKYILNHENHFTLTDKNTITNNDRNQVMNKLQPQKINKDIINELKKRVSHLINLYKLDAVISEKDDCLLIESDPANKKDCVFSFSTRLFFDRCLRDMNKEISDLENQFKEIAVAVECTKIN